MAHERGHAMSKAMEECIRMCIECARTCEACYGECVRMDMSGMAKCIALCRDCADICMTDAHSSCPEDRSSTWIYVPCAQMSVTHVLTNASVWLPNTRENRRKCSVAAQKSAAAVRNRAERWPKRPDRYCAAARWSKDHQT